jgi:hypothetical protein
MNFLEPAAFAFAASLPVVVLFYLLKRRRTVKLVSSTLLWQRFLAETRANAPFQKLRHNWLLLLQLLLLALAVLALARPYFAGQISGGRLIIAILDASASMQSHDESPSRFERARAAALELVDTLRPDDQMVVLQAALVTEVKQSPTHEKVALRRALQACRAADTPTRLTEALKLAETLTRNHPKAEIHLFSDGAAADLRDFENRSLNLIYHAVGQRAENAGIVSLDVRANPENPGQRAVFTGVLNCSTNTRSAEVELRFNGRLLESRVVILPPRETTPLVFLASQSEPGVFSVHLVTEDDLAADNRASIVSLLSRPVRVRLVTQGNRFLERALQAAPRVELTTASQLDAGGGEGADLVVLDGVFPAVWPKGNFLAIQVAETNWFSSLSRVETPAIVDWQGAHPLLRFVSLDNVAIGSASVVGTPPWAVNLVDAPQGALAVAGELGRQRIVWLGFDTLASTWPLRLSFPIFIANAVEWLDPQTQSSAQLLVRAGEAFRLPLAEPGASARLKLADGTERKLDIEPARGEVVFPDTLQQGVYQLTVGTNTTTFCVNLLDPLESDLTPRAELQIGRQTATAAATVRRANLERWRWFAAAALGVLLFEWWFYHRRTA